MKTAFVRLTATIALLGFAGLVAGCGERAQVIAYKSGRYQGKPDSKPWENDPSVALAASSKWTPGDKASWEAALRTRAQGQNEYSRTQ